MHKDCVVHFHFTLMCWVVSQKGDSSLVTLTYLSNPQVVTSLTRSHSPRDALSQWYYFLLRTQIQFRTFVEREREIESFLFVIFYFLGFASPTPNVFQDCIVNIFL